MSREARLVTLSSPNLGTVTPCANLVLTSEVTDGVANTAPVPQGMNKVFSRKAGTEALSASHLRNKATNKAPQRASLSKSSSVKFALQSEVNGSSLCADSGAYAASAPKGATKVLSREARTKALSMPIAFVVMKRTRHPPVLRFQGLWMLSPSLIKL